MMSIKTGAGTVKVEMSYIFATFFIINTVTIEFFQRISNGFIKKSFSIILEREDWDYFRESNYSDKDYGINAKGFSQLRIFSTTLRIL